MRQQHEAASGLSSNTSAPPASGWEGHSRGGSPRLSWCRQQRPSSLIALPASEGEGGEEGEGEREKEGERERGDGDEVEGGCKKEEEGGGGGEGEGRSRVVLKKA